MKHIALITLLAAQAFALPALAQSPTRGCPAGTVFSIVRMSTIKPEGSMAGFEEAAKDHVKWYRDHGYKDNQISSSPVLETSDNGKTWTVSKTKVFAIHKNDPGVQAKEQDAAWNAYVAKYRANSDIASTTVVCLPK